MVADALTKLWTAAQGQLLLAFLSSGRIRITYCEHSWRRELERSRGELRQLAVPDPVWQKANHEAESAHVFQGKLPQEEPQEPKDGAGKAQRGCEMLGPCDVDGPLGCPQGAGSLDPSRAQQLMT